MSLSILVVTYNCSLDYSQTIHSLLASNVRFDKVHLCVWNNGPQKIAIDTKMLESLREKGFDVIVKQTPWNAPLSWIYNYFIEKNPADRYVILDHDSTLSEEYLQYIVGSECVFVGMPIVNIKGAPRYPLVRKRFFTGPYHKDDEIRTVGSGLVISQEAVDAVKRLYGNVFDENFALYEVDTSFIQRVQKVRGCKQFKIIPSIDHSFSDFEEEKKEIKRFRRIERSYSFGLQLRHYPTRRALCKLKKQILRSFRGKNKILITKALKAFILGRHKRCKQPKLHTLIE